MYSFLLPSSRTSEKCAFDRRQVRQAAAAVDDDDDVTRRQEPGVTEPVVESVEPGRQAEVAAVAHAGR